MTNSDQLQKENDELKERLEAKNSDAQVWANEAMRKDVEINELKEDKEYLLNLIHDALSNADTDECGHRYIGEDGIYELEKISDCRGIRSNEVNELRAHIERLREAALKMEESILRGDYLRLHFDKDVMVEALAETPSQSLNHIKEPLQKEINELKAHIERLRSINDSVKHYLADIQHGVERTASAELMLIAELERAFFSASPQSLNHILSQVEEETIERCELYVTSRYDENGLYPSVMDMPRKYKEQSDEEYQSDIQAASGGMAQTPIEG